MSTTLPAEPERLDALDALRGFALLGILVVNIQWFASAWWAEGLSDPRDVAALDSAVRWLVAFAFEGKFYLLFSFAFGYSFTLVMRRGPHALPRYRRRLAVLAVLGAVHALLLFHGDVLLFYAAVGTLLPLAHRWSVGRVVATAASVQLGVAAVLLMLARFTEVGDLQAYAQEGAARAAAAEASMRAGVAELLWLNLQTWSRNLLPVSLVQLPNMLAWLLLGHAAARLGLLERSDRSNLRGLASANASSSRAVPAAVAGVGLAGLVGVVGQAFYAFSARSIDPAVSLQGAVALTLTAPAMSLLYAAAVLHAPRAWRRALGTAGRMSLTNYLLQSVVLALVFTGWGWGASGRLRPGTVLLIALATFAVQLLLSRWWLSRQRQGPLEALVRRLARREALSAGGPTAPR